MVEEILGNGAVEIMSPKSIIGLTEHLKSLYKKGAEKLKGSDRRQFMAEVVKGLGIGGQTVAERELGQITLTPDGIFLPQYNELYLFFVDSKLTAENITRSNVVLVG
jgi:hypothetical protein